MELLKKAIGFAIGFIVVFVVIHFMRGGDKLEAFEPYHSEEGRFSVLFPGEPKRETQVCSTPIGEIDLVMYSAGTKKSGFVVGHSDYPQEMVDSADLQVMLDGARDGAVRNVKGKLISEISFDFNGYPGREIEIGVPKGGTVKARLILVDNRLYQVIVASQSSSVLEEKCAEFFDSFELMKGSE